MVSCSSPFQGFWKRSGLATGGVACYYLCSEAAAVSAEEVAVNANKLHHIFGKAAHGLADLVSKIGSEEAAFKALQQAAEVAAQAQGLKGVFEIIVKVAGENVVVRGNVVNGIVKIGTAFLK